MTRVILVRHGETDWVKEDKYQGNSDIPLNERGIDQAKLVADRLKDEKIDITYTSELSRAIRTAEEILKFHSVKLIKNKEINERGYGKWEGLTKKEVQEKYPGDFDEYQKNRYPTRPTAGESFVDIRNRVEPFIKKIVEENKDKNILIVCHNGPLRVILGILMNYTNEKIASLYFGITSLTIINLSGEEPTLEVVNCDKHMN
ncbi:MAG: histidine phosphatase family protein [Nanoarchaeota archaeon]|nr:histidine phosphatase family protein [Nanoarchaeota archaeon]